MRLNFKRMLIVLAAVALLGTGSVFASPKEVTFHAARVAASTQAAIVYLNENQGRRFVSEYRDHLTTIADSLEDMKQAVDRFLDYEKTQ